MPGIFIVFFIGALILIIVGAYYGNLAKQKRELDLAALATGLGWRYSPDEDEEFENRYPQFSMFQSGGSRYAFNTMAGSLSVGGRLWPAVMGDYHYTTTSTDKDGHTTTHTHHFSFLVVEMPFGRTPDLYIRPEGFFDKIKRAMGFDDIDFESAEFSKRFFVKSSDKKFAFDVIHPTMMEFFLAGPAPPPVYIAQGGCCIGGGSGTWTPDEFRANVEWARRFFEQWPKYLTSTLQEKSTNNGR